jgi:hypothetical protein
MNQGPNPRLTSVDILEGRPFPVTTENPTVNLKLAVSDIQGEEKRYSPPADRKAPETVQMHLLFTWIASYLEFTADGSTIPFGEIYANYEEFAIDCQTIGVRPLRKQSVGILLPAYSWLVYKKEVRKFLRNKTVFYEGVRWREITYRMAKELASGANPLI